MLKSMLIVMSMMALIGLSGCGSTGPSAETSGSAVVAGKANCHAECLVCKYDADLACIDVEVEKETPSYTYNGKTYYFCSGTCAKKFQANPEKYVNQK